MAVFFGTRSGTDADANIGKHFANASPGEIPLAGVIPWRGNANLKCLVIVTRIWWKAGSMGIPWTWRAVGGNGWRPTTDNDKWRGDCTLQSMTPTGFYPSSTSDICQTKPDQTALATLRQWLINIIRRQVCHDSCLFDAPIQHLGTEESYSLPALTTIPFV